MFTSSFEKNSGVFSKATNTLAGIGNFSKKMTKTLRSNTAKNLSIARKTGQPMQRATVTKGGRVYGVHTADAIPSAGKFRENVTAGIYKKPVAQPLQKTAGPLSKALKANPKLNSLSTGQKKNILWAQRPQIQKPEKAPLTAVALQKSKINKFGGT